MLANDTDADGDSLTARLIGGPSHGRLTLDSNGSFSYLPDADFFGNDSFTYAADDGLGRSQATEVRITVADVSDVPLPVPGAGTRRPRSRRWQAQRQSRMLRFLRSARRPATSLTRRRRVPVLWRRRPVRKTLESAESGHGVSSEWSLGSRSGGKVAVDPGRPGRRLTRRGSPLERLAKARTTPVPRSAAVRHARQRSGSCAGRIAVRQRAHVVCDE